MEIEPEAEAPTTEDADNSKKDEPDTVDLIDATGAPMAKKIVPLAAGFLLLWMLIRRRKRST